MPTLRLRLVPTSGSPLEVSKDSTLVGRDPSADLMVNDGSVSRKHARLERRGDTWYVVDQASANGTFVDSQRVSESALQPGQEVRFGAVPFRVEVAAELDPSATIGPDDNDATLIQPVLSASPARPASPMAPPPPPPPAPPLAPPPAPGPRVAPPPPATGPVSTPTGAPATPAAAKPKSPVFWIGAGCCGCSTLLLLFFGLIFGGSIAALFGARAAPLAVVRSQLEEVRENKLDAAYARFSEAYRLRLSPEDFQALIAAHPSLRDNKDYTFNNWSIVNDTARFIGKLNASTGESEGVTYELVKENGEWKISGIRFEGDITLPEGNPELGSP